MWWTIALIACIACMAFAHWRFAIASIGRMDTLEYRIDQLRFNPDRVGALRDVERALGMYRESLTYRADPGNAKLEGADVPD